MKTTESARKWMQALAQVRTKAVKLRMRPGSTAEPALDLLDETLELTEAIRAECSTLQQRCADLLATLESSEAEIRALFDLLPTAVVATDAAGIIMDANRAGATLLGRSAPRLKHELLLHFSEDRDAFTALVRQLPHAAEPIHTTIRLRPRERAPLDVEITVARDARSGDSRWLWCMNRLGPQTLR